MFLTNNQNGFQHKHSSHSCYCCSAQYMQWISIYISLQNTLNYQHIRNTTQLTKFPNGLLFRLLIQLLGATCNCLVLCSLQTRQGVDRGGCQLVFKMLLSIQLSNPATGTFTNQSAAPPTHTHLRGNRLSQVITKDIQNPCFKILTFKGKHCTLIDSLQMKRIIYNFFVLTNSYSVWSSHLPLRFLYIYYLFILSTQKMDVKHFF